jgi:SWI/SNF-related matrix-associated actin-dependent regulator of chromatin subfamily A3
MLLQKQALQWAIEHENPKLPTKEEDKPVQFWQYRKTASKVHKVCKPERNVYSPPCRHIITIVRIRKDWL